ncbi:ExbD/TolR family protein [Methanobacterium alcaliphilum]|uniref:ExbD/TolR family protein n=1 Tax=Methanobacterium alcaliphilum TaxID=392018 RepID=UPI00200B6D3C|nr:biopolymer transporter ExbD [Methanobacterium alcaliphilum]MCK9150383.1 biopolymer transporter ExbD [Methanobacterium alcaliphilum]
MAMDVNKYRKKLKDNNPRFNMVPFIDILFTLLIFVIVTSSFQVADESATSGKPEQVESSGPSEYYQIPVAGLKKVTVNGVDMSQYIRNNAIAVHTRVIDEGEIIIKPKQGLIIITAPPDMAVDKAVKAPT